MKEDESTYSWISERVIAMVQRGNDELGLYVGKGEDGGFKRCLSMKSSEPSDGINMDRGRELRDLKSQK